MDGAYVNVVSSCMIQPPFDDNRLILDVCNENGTVIIDVENVTEEESGSWKCLVVYAGIGAEEQVLAVKNERKW